MRNNWPVLMHAAPMFIVCLGGALFLDTLLLGQVEAPDDVRIIGQDEQRSAPAYVRENPTRASGAWKHPQTGEWIFDARYKDIDISYDGEHWFHLLGAVCTKGSPRQGIN